MHYMWKQYKLPLGWFNHFAHTQNTWDQAFKPMIHFSSSENVARGHCLRSVGGIVTLVAAPPPELVLAHAGTADWPQKNPWWSSSSQTPQPKEPRSASPGSHRIRILLHNSSMPHCHLPNDQLSGLPRGCLSQRQPENCWGNILFYWKWFPSNCCGPDLDSRLTNIQ